MFTAFIQWLTKPVEDRGGAIPADSPLRPVVQRLIRLEPERALYIGCFGLYMAKVAGANKHVAPGELKTMREILTTVGALFQAEATIIIQIALAPLENNSDDATLQDDALGQLAELFRSVSSITDRRGLMEALFAVAIADNTLGEDELATIDAIARSLSIDMAYITSLKQSYELMLTQARSEANGADDESRESPHHDEADSAREAMLPLRRRLTPLEGHTLQHQLEAKGIPSLHLFCHHNALEPWLMLSEVWVSAAQLLEAQTVIETLADQEALEGDDDAQADASDHADFDIVCAHCGTPATAEARVCELCGQPLPD